MLTSRIRFLLLVADALQALRRERSTLLPALILPSVGLLAMDWIFELLRAQTFYWFASWFLQLPFYTLIAVTCHRVIILGRSLLPSPAGLYWTRRETVFLGWLIGLGLLLAALTVVDAFRLLLPEWTGTGVEFWVYDFVAFLLIAYFLMRFSLVLPAAALQHRLSFADSWKATRGNGLVLALAVAVPAYLATLLFMGLDTFLADAETLIAQVPYRLVLLLQIILHIAILSVAYKYLVFVSPSEGADS